MQIILETHSERDRILEFDCDQRNHFIFLALDPCSSDPCQNGVCNSTAVGYKCTCYPDYSGTNCDKGLYAILAMLTAFGYADVRSHPLVPLQFSY